MFKKRTIAVLSLVSTLFIPSAYSQEKDAATAWQEITEKGIEQKFQSVHVEGDLKVSIESQDMASDLGKINLDLLVNDEPIAFQVVADAASPFLGNAPIAFELYAKDGFTYTLDGHSGQWKVEEWGSSSEEIKAEFEKLSQKMVDKYSFDELTADQTDFINKYLDFKEEGTDYLFSFKKEIDGKEFYADLDAAFDLEKLIEETVKEAKKQAEDLGEEANPQYESGLKEMLNPENFKVFFDMNPSVETTYDSQTGMVKDVKISIDLGQEFLKSVIETGDPESVPEKVNVEFNLAYDQYGQAPAVQVPEEAMNQDETEETDELDSSSLEETTVAQ